MSGRKLEDRLANKIEGLYGLREASDRISLEYGCHVMKDFKPIGKYRRKDYSGKLQETTIKRYMKMQQRFGNHELLNKLRN